MLWLLLSAVLCKCQDGWVSLNGGAWCFGLGSEATQWGSQTCNGEGQIFTGVGSRKELDLIGEQLLIGKGDVWVAGKVDSEGTWVWTDGTLGDPRNLIEQETRDKGEKCVKMAMSVTEVSPKITTENCQIELRPVCRKPVTALSRIPNDSYIPQSVTFSWSQAGLELPGNVTRYLAQTYPITTLQNPVANCTVASPPSEVRIVYNSVYEVYLHDPFYNRSATGSVSVHWRTKNKIHLTGLDFSKETSFLILLNTTSTTIHIYIDGVLRASTIEIPNVDRSTPIATETDPSVHDIVEHQYMISPPEHFAYTETGVVFKPCSEGTVVSGSMLRTTMSTGVDLVRCKEICLNKQTCVSIGWDPDTSECTVNTLISGLVNTTDSFVPSEFYQCWDRIVLEKLPLEWVTSGDEICQGSLRPLDETECGETGGIVSKEGICTDTVANQARCSVPSHIDNTTNCGQLRNENWWELSNCSYPSWMMYPVHKYDAPILSVWSTFPISLEVFCCDGETSIVCVPVTPLIYLTLEKLYLTPVNLSSSYLRLVLTPLQPDRVSGSLNFNVTEGGVTDASDEALTVNTEDTEQYTKVLSFIVGGMFLVLFVSGHTAYFMETGLIKPDVREEECPKIPAQPTFTTDGGSVPRPSLPNTIHHSPPSMVSKFAMGAVEGPQTSALPPVEERLIIRPSGRVRGNELVAQQSEERRWHGPGAKQSIQEDAQDDEEEQTEKEDQGGSDVASQQQLQPQPQPTQQSEEEEEEEEEQEKGKEEQPELGPDEVRTPETPKTPPDDIRTPPEVEHL